MKILAVDDDPGILEVLRLALGRAGYRDFTATPMVDDAIRMIGDIGNRFDCFLLYIQMPEMSGIELCARIRKMEKYRSTPILMITAMTEKSYIDRAFVAGATDYVTKPFDLGELVASLREAERSFPKAGKGAEPASIAPEAVPKPPQASALPISDPTPVDGVEGVIDLITLEKYLLQLSRGNLFATSVFALGLDKAEEIAARCSPLRYQAILAGVARMALNQLVGADCILAHAGKGAFAGVLSNAATLDAEEIERGINANLPRLRLTDNEDKPMKLLVAFGDLRPVGLMQSGRSAVNMLRRAITDIARARPIPAFLDHHTLLGSDVFLKALLKDRG